jgi:hypothetical protein
LTASFSALGEASIVLETPAGRTYTLQCYKHLAQKLAIHLFKDEVRLTGWGEWKRDPDDGWQLKRFVAQSFVVLGSTPLSDVVASLHAIEGAAWTEFDDPWEVLSDLRRDDQEITR